MKAQIREDGCLIIYAENHTEAYALKEWHKGDLLLSVDTGNIPVIEYEEDRVCEAPKGTSKKVQ